MAQDCPLCFSKGIFPSWTGLKDNLVNLCTRAFTCPICFTLHEGLDKFTLHLVSHEAKMTKEVPILSIKENNNNLDTLDELLADFSEFVRQEDKHMDLNYDNQVKLRTKAPNPLRLSPKIKSPLGNFKPACPNSALITNIQLPDRPVYVPSATVTTHNIQPTADSQHPPLQRVQLHNLNKEEESNQSSTADGDALPQQVQCGLCGWNFDNDSFLQLHMVLMHSKRSNRRLKKVVDEYKCRDCDSSFKVYEDFLNHIKGVHNDNRFVCHICAKVFKLRGSLLVHLRVVHNPIGEGNHHCKICNRKFTNMHRRDVHEKKHTDAKQFECSKCGMTFEEKGEFEIHMETHDTEHTCRICSRSFYTQAALFIHSMGHQNQTDPTLTTPQLQHKVPECTVTPANLEANRSDLSVYKCMTCEKSFKRESHLNQHMKVHDNKLWECEVCKKTFTTKYFLKKHKRLHTGETPYACNICGKSFTFQQSYHKHMLYHTDDKPYTCSQCGRAFKELSTLQNHERIHSGERPFECETCGKSFRQRVSYLVHRRIHTGVMPYVCNDCGKCFRYKVTQRTHKCLGKSGDTSPLLKPLPNPLAEENATINMPSLDLPQQIKDDLMTFRKSQGRKFLQGRLQGYLLKSKERSNHHGSLVPSPINQMEHLSLSDHNHAQSMPNIESILFEPTPAKEDPSIKTESVDDFDLQAFL